jgi:hypothetical protein
MSDPNSSQEIICPYCGAKNSVGVFCAECGKRIKGDEPNDNEKATLSYQAPPSMNPQTNPPYISKSHRRRNILIGIFVAIIAVSLVVGAIIYSQPNTVGNDPIQGLSSPTPQTNSPQSSPTATSTPLTTPVPTVGQTMEITGINLQFQYCSADQNYFGAATQSIAISNQPNQVLTVNQGSQFFLYFTLTASTAGSGDSITAITVGTSGFSVVSIQPQVPIAYSPGVSQQITVTLTAPNASFNGPVQLVLSTSGGTTTETQPPQ